MNKNVCSFFGHRKIDITNGLKEKLYSILKRLIIENNVDTFLFGSKSEFDDLCCCIITELKEKFPYIKRVYVRAEFPHIDDDYKKYLLQFYDETYYPEKIINSGKAAYVERNCEMVDKSDLCVIYYDENYTPQKRKSGTKIAYEYAIKKGKKIINIAV